MWIGRLNKNNGYVESDYEISEIGKIGLYNTTLNHIVPLVLVEKYTTVVCLRYLCDTYLYTVTKMFSNHNGNSYKLFVSRQAISCGIKWQVSSILKGFRI